ncbi:MAG: hypothetical protein M1826_001447 [Phylliscum demangeonii]|nr:MAG: hypothetical protein M1826_001447 [Phylliscum demangeonii]
MTTNSHSTPEISTRGSLHTRPLQYSLDLETLYGIHDYDYDELVVKAPSNLPEIQRALAADRDDAPTMKEYLSFCRETSSERREDFVPTLLRRFLDIPDRYSPPHIYGKVPWSNFVGHLPPQQRAFTPDITCGLSPMSKALPAWFAARTPGYVQQGEIVCANGVLECKSGHGGSMVTARIQNRAIAALAAQAWHQLARDVLDDDSDALWHASVGSICFDGNTIEASVHWLEPATSAEEDREFDVYSYRLAAGPAFAVSLEQFQATQKIFRNLMAWLTRRREECLERIKRIPPPVPLFAKQPHDNDNDDDDVDALPPHPRKPGKSSRQTKRGPPPPNTVANPVSKKRRQG